MPQNQHDGADRSSRDLSTASSGPDTTGAPHIAQADAPATVASPSSASHEIVATVGSDRWARSVFLARDLATVLSPASRSSESLLVLVAPPTDPAAFESVRVLERGRISPPRECYVCAAPRTDDLRFCGACGATLVIIVAGAAREQSAAARLEAVRATTGAQLAVVGDMPASDGGSIYFAREANADGALLALVPYASALPGEPAMALVLEAMPAMDAVQPSLPARRETTAGDVATPNRLATPPDTVAVAEDPLVGRLVDGKYRILRQLGQGGMGRVFDARHEELRSRRAIKVMHPYLQSRADLVTRFYEEARNAERVKHEHVCSVHDFGSSDGLIYIAMEYIDGEPLSALIKRERRIAPARVAGIITQTAAALDAAHALKIVHRDVKPDNIMLCRRDDGRDDVKVVDFGISKALNRSELTSAGSDTQLGVVIGTLDYMSDEQRRGLEVDNRTDVYALGRTAVKMLFGELPEHGAWKEWSRTRVNPALAVVLGRSLAPHDERYASAGDFSRDLARALRRSPDRASGVLDHARDWTRGWTHSLDALRRRPRLVASVAGGAVLLAALAFGAPAVMRLASHVSTRDAARVVPGRGIGDSTTPPPVVAALDASPSAVSFESHDGAVAPTRREVRVTVPAGTIAGDLGVDDVQYDGAGAGWLARPMWRDGKASAPATLVLQPRAADMTPGTYTARVRIMSPASPDVGTTITATLVVKPPTIAVTSADVCSASRSQLARIKQLTDPVHGTEAGARRVVGLVPTLVPSLCTESEQVEAQLRLAEAYMTLSQSDRACGVLRKIEPQAAATPFAHNVELFLSRCP